MNQEERSERSRTAILEAALDLFARQGYRATSIRDIATKAAVSTGSVYHHFRDKDAIFQALLNQYFDAIKSPDYPVNRVLAKGTFPDDLEALGRAARESVRQWRKHATLIYVDVIEFEGRHIQRFYADMSHRFDAFLERHKEDLPLQKLRPEIPPSMAMMFATRAFFNYFAVEILFGVSNFYGLEEDKAVEMFADILKHGILKPGEN